MGAAKENSGGNPANTFDLARPGAYEIGDLGALCGWEYIYQNGEILLRTDRYGPYLMQAEPPQGLALFKRERGGRYAEWLVWVRGDGAEGGAPLSNFGRPGAVRPGKYRIRYAPEKAVYTAVYRGVSMETELYVPRRGASAVMRCTVRNLTEREQHFTVTPACRLLAAPANAAPWDQAEWYLNTSARAEEGATVFVTRRTSPEADPAGRKTLVFVADAGAKRVWTGLERFQGAGDFYAPDEVCLKEVERGEVAASETYGYPPVYAAEYEVALSPGGQRTFTQALSVYGKADFGAAELADAKRYLSPEAAFQAERENAAYYEKLFTARSVRTGDALFDAYVNAFLPLQMDWAASLDRGWPTGMRGVRDAANDFMGLLPIGPQRAKTALLALFSAERTDGWLPRQISAAGKGGKHDLRNYADGGAFALEFLTEYLAYTGDFALLSEPLPWLDAEDAAPLASHAIQAARFYLAQENIGEHGLCKIWGGDWLDALSKAGCNGRGESVMLTGQAVLVLRRLSELFHYLGDSAEAEELQAGAERFQKSLKSAVNAREFFSGVFTDGGFWAFSDRDPDGAERVYGPANYYAALAGAAEDPRRLLKFCMSALQSETGYRLFSPPLGKTPIPNLGRIASGDQQPYLWENGNAYNHGSHGFLARALAACQMPEELGEVLFSMLPYDEGRHPAVLTLTPPYAVVNCYQETPCFFHRGGTPFLTGTVAMALRAVYDFMLGISWDFGGLRLAPCIPKRWGNVSARFNFRGKSFQITYVPQERRRVLLNGAEVRETKRLETGGVCAFLQEGLFLRDNEIVYYGK